MIAYKVYSVLIVNKLINNALLVSQKIENSSITRSSLYYAVPSTVVIMQSECLGMTVIEEDTSNSNQIK